MFPTCLLKSIIISYKEKDFSGQLNSLPVPRFTLACSQKGANLCGNSWKNGNQDTQIKIWLRFTQTTMGLLPWLPTRSLIYVVRIPLAVQARVRCHHPFSSRNAQMQKFKMNWLASTTWHMHCMRKLLPLPFCCFENALHESFFLAYAPS